MSNPATFIKPHADWIRTDAFAALNKIRHQTVRKRYCLTGSYFGVKPTKLANGRLLWPAVVVVA